jgi:tetratricopeptide (TPR) repeat protein
MCKKGARSPSGLGRAGLITLALAVLLAPRGAAGQAVTSPQVTGVEMTPQVRQTLRQLEEQWLEWIVQNNREQADRAVTGLLDIARQLGTQRLPDLAGGAIARAVTAARQKDFPRAHWALEAAERFDPGRPETAFAESTVDRLQGDFLGAATARLRAYPRIFNHPLESYLWLQDLLFWALVLLLVTGGLFFAVQMLTKGTAMFQDLADAFGRRLPRSVALALAGAVLLWPVALSYGPLWLPLYWSVLLWGYASTSERVVMIAIWLLLGAAPQLVELQREQVAVALSPPALAMESLQEHRLYGSLFADLGLLRAVLPESVAVKHLLADLHRSLNQWEIARSLYRQVLEAEPNNASALLDLGNYAFLKGDFTSAIQSYQQAAAADPLNPAPPYNLSQAYSESYLFDEQKAALKRAQDLDLKWVNSWIANPPPARVVSLLGGIARIPQIRRELAATWVHRETRAAPLEILRQGQAPFLALGLVLIAVSLQLARRPFGKTERGGEVFPEGAFERWGRALLPGVGSAEIGEGGKSFFALLVFTALLMLPLIGRIGTRIPWRYDPGNLLSWVLAILGLAIYFGARLRRELRHGG